MDFIHNLLEFNDIYDVMQFVMFASLVLFSVLFILLSYWFEFIAYYKRKHGYNVADNVLTDTVEAKLVKVCNIQDADTQVFMRKCLKIALDDK